MQITESFTLSKTGSRENNEDALFINQRFIAVTDGVTAKTAGPEAAAVSGGRFAAQTICALLNTPPDTDDPVQLILYLNEGLKAAIAGSVFAGQPEPPSASVMLYDIRHCRIISYGDCQALWRGKTHKREKRLDRICAEKRAQILEDYIRAGQTVPALLACDPGRKAIEPDILSSFLAHANQYGEYGFPVLGTGSVIPEYIDVYPVKAGDEIVLASDGYPVLLPTLQKSEQALASIIRQDPLLFRQYRSTKGVTAGNISYDDRTYVRFTAK